MKYFKKYSRSGFCRLLMATALTVGCLGWATHLAAQVPVIRNMEIRPSERSGLTNRDMQRICTAAIATLFEQPAAAINLDGTRQGMMLLSSTSPGDGASRRYTCKVAGDEVIWARQDDTGQNDDPERQVTFQLTGDDILITVTSSDGSEKQGRFPR